MQFQRFKLSIASKSAKRYTWLSSSARLSERHEFRLTALDRGVDTGTRLVLLKTLPSKVQQEEFQSWWRRPQGTGRALQMVVSVGQRAGPGVADDCCWTCALAPLLAVDAVARIADLALPAITGSRRSMNTWIHPRFVLVGTSGMILV